MDFLKNLCPTDCEPLKKLVPVGGRGLGVGKVVSQNDTTSIYKILGKDKSLGTRSRFTIAWGRGWQRRGTADGYEVFV